MRVDVREKRPAEILLVDDNRNDVDLTTESFRKARLAINLHHVKNGEECLEFLRKQGSYAGAPAPDLVLLDLNMPVMDGREVLAEIVRDDRLNHLPVVVLTTSGDEKDVQDMYKLRCNEYVTKPVDSQEFHEVIKRVGDHWFTVPVLPMGRC